MGIFGKTWKINRVAKGSPDVYYQMGGTIINATIDPRITVHSEAGSTQRQLASHKVVEAKPVLDFDMNVRRLDDYIIPYGMPSGEAAVPAHTLYVTDGTEHHDFSSAKVNTCRVRINTTESIRASIQAALKTDAAPSLGTFLYRTEKAMYKDAVTTLTIEGSPITGWKEIEFGVDNKVMQECLGTSIPPSEVEEQEAVYSGHIHRAKPSASKYATAIAGTPQDLVIALTDKQSSPVTKTFTFADALMKTAKIEDRALGLVMERIEWEGSSLVIN